MPLEELQRLQAVNRFLKLEMDSHKELNEIVRVAADICEAPVALITLLDNETQHIRFQVGFDKKTTPVRDAFCRYAIQSTDLLQIPDALKDPRFSSNPLVSGEPNIRFYAGSPLTTQDGQSLGSLCVIDTVPRELDNRQQKMLRILSRQAMQILEFELSIAVLKEQVIRTKQSENKLRSFFESSVSCHLLLGKRFEVLAYNKVVSEFINELFGIEIREGMDIKDFLHKDHVGTFIKNYTNALQGQTVISEQELRYNDGRKIYWYIAYEPAYTKEMEVIGVSYNATDITERIRQEQLVYAQNESLRKIAFIQSHELRRPVSSILGLIELIRSEPDPNNISEELDMLDVAARELDGKIREIVEHTEQDHGL